MALRFKNNPLRQQAEALIHGPSGFEISLHFLCRKKRPLSGDGSMNFRAHPEQAATPLLQVTVQDSVSGSARARSIQYMQPLALGTT